jgi:hypothetical protein
MQHRVASKWVVLTLSAEQALHLEDFEHFQELIQTRDALLDSLRLVKDQLSAADWAAINRAEDKLNATASSGITRVGAELSRLNSQRKAATQYATSAS